MKKVKHFGIAIILIHCSPLFAHGPGHSHGAMEASAEVNEALDLGPGRTGMHAGHDLEEVSPTGKSFKAPVEDVERWWGASLQTGWESRHVHYGVDETGPSGAYSTEVLLWMGDFSISAWSGFGTGNSFEEWNFTVAYNLEVGPVFFIPGYNFRYSPGVVEEGHDSHEDHGHEEEDHAHEEDGHDEHGEEDSHAGHAHNEYGNELFFVIGTNAIPYVTPSAVFIWDLNNTPGALLEFRLDGDVALYKDILTIQPYTLLALNFGYNTRSYYGWNNWQFGLELTWKIARHVEIFGGVNYSVAMTALQDIGQDNVVWANTGIRLSY